MFGSMNFSYNKMEYGSKMVDSVKETENGVYNMCKEDLHKKTNSARDGPTMHTKPSDVRNGDLVSLLLAATPPYLYNMHLVPQTFFFSEMLRSFVQAKVDRQNVKSQQIHHRRTRKRAWRELSPAKPNQYDVDKPLELTTPRQPVEDKQKPSTAIKRPVTEPVDKPKPTEVNNSNFTVEKLANSSVADTNTQFSTVPEPQHLDTPQVPAPPLWYPPLYPTHPPYGIDPLHFFIDLRVSAHIWDRKMAAEKENLNTLAPLNLQTTDTARELDKPMPVLEPSLRNRHNSAFCLPAPRDPDFSSMKGKTNMHYIMQNLKEIYNQEQKEDKAKEEVEEVDEEGKKKKVKDLRALIGLELVVDYVKQESDDSEDEEEGTGAKEEEAMGVGDQSEECDIE